MLRGKSWNDGWLTAYWGREEGSRSGSKDLIFGSPNRPDGHLLYWALTGLEVCDKSSLVKELEARGYDITTLQFSIRRKKSEEKAAMSLSE